MTLEGVNASSTRPKTSQSLASSAVSPMNRPGLSFSRKNSSFVEEVQKRKFRRQRSHPDASGGERTRLIGDSARSSYHTSDSRSSSQSSTQDSLVQSALEKKSDLIVDEIDRLGFGRYQWHLFFVCGSGWLLDLLWAHAFGLAMPAIQRELGFSESQYGYLSTGFSIGMTAGALTWGILLDIVGRRAAFNYTVAISSAFGICTGFCSSYPLLIVLASGVGFGVGGNIPVDTTIFLEFIPKKNRTMLVVMSIFQPIGSILSTLLGWTFIPSFSCPSELESCTSSTDGECCSKNMNMGWRYMFYSISALTLLIFGLRFIVFTMLESPAYLIARNEDEKVVRVMQKMASRNGAVTELTLEQLSSQTDDELEVSYTEESTGVQSLLRKQLSSFDLSHLQLLFKSPYCVRLTLLTWLIYAADFWGFTLAGVFLPKILLQKGAQLHTSLSDTYLTYILIALAGIPGSLISMYFVWTKISRRLVMAVSSAMMATSLFLFATVTSSTGNLAFNMVEFFCQTIFNAVLYAWTPEVFESSVRGSATGIAAFWGRLISIVAPLFGGLIFAGDNGGDRVLFAAGGGTLVATLSILLLP